VRPAVCGDSPSCRGRQTPRAAPTNRAVAAARDVLLSRSMSRYVRWFLVIHVALVSLASFGS